MQSLRANHSKTAAGPAARQGECIFVCLTLLLGCGLLTQCALRPIPRDLAVYYNRDISGIVELEDLALQRYAAVTGDSYISDQVLRKSLDHEIIPAYVRFADLISRIKPTTEPVEKLHALYREAAALRLRGFRMVLLAIDNQDPDIIRQANRMLDQSRQHILLWRAELAEMSRDYGLERNSVHRQEDGH